jgi:hypothetical protein
MYSNVVYASLWKAMNGFSESIVEDVPIRNTPPCLIVLPPLLPEPPPQAATASTAAAAASRAAGLCLRSPLIGSPITRYFLNERLRCVILT